MISSLFSWPQWNFFMEIKIRELAEEAIEKAGLSDCYIVDVSVRGQKIEVFMDADEGVTFLKCQKVSRYIESYLDESKVLGESYTLDVSSPGLARPLTIPRQYKKNIGRRFDILRHSDDRKLTGTLTDVEEEFIVVENEMVEKEGKKKKKVTVKHEIPFEDIKRAVIKIEF